MSIANASGEMAFFHMLIRCGSLSAAARELGLTVLVEVHDEAETERAVALGAELIGVNARNLKTLAVDNETFGRLAPLVPADRVLVAESGTRDGGERADQAVVADAERVGGCLGRGDRRAGQRARARDPARTRSATTAAAR